MPTYCYSCENCGNSFEHTCSMSQMTKTRKCPSCGKRAYHDFVSDHKYGNTDSQMREYSIDGSSGTRLYTASYLPSQVDEMKKRHPGRDFKFINGCYLPVIRNRTDKLKYLRERNYVEYD